MRLWLPLLLAPTMALADQVIAFAAVNWACEHRQAIVLHAIHAAFLLATAATLLPASRAWHASRGPADATAQRRRFLVDLAVAAASLSVLVIAAMWLTAWWIPPCVS